MPQTYTVKTGDTKALLQKKFGIQLSDSQYRSSDPNKLFAGEVLKIGAPTSAVGPGLKQGPEQFPGQLRPVVNNGKVDISAVKDGIEPMATTVVSSVDNPDGTTTNTTADGGTDKGRYVRNPDGTLTFVPVAGGATTTTQDTQNDGSFTSTIKTLQDEIKTIEERMANRSSDRNAALDTAGVFDDLRKLNESKARLREAQDKEIEIDIKGRQKLRGQSATKTEFNQLTRPALEKNVLEQLAASRETSRLTDDINTNINIIDSSIDALTKQDEFLYKQKQERLDTVTKIYGDIMTEQQKEAAEARKFQYDLALEGVKTENSLRSDLLKDIANMGTNGVELQGLMTASIDDLINYKSSASSPTKWSEMSYEEAAMKLNPDQFKKYEAYKNFEKTASEEEKAAADQLTAVSSQAGDTIALLEELINNKNGLKNSVGTLFGNTIWGQNLGVGGLFGVVTDSADANRFRTKAKQLMSQATLDKIIEVKSAGATLGAITEKELEILGNAATALGSVDKDGKPTGRFNLSESDFIEALETMRLASMKTYVAANIGSDRYNAANLKNASFETVSKLYEDLKANGNKPVTNYADQGTRGNTASPVSFRSSPSSASYYQPTKALSVAFDTIRKEEGLRTEAYQDVGGKWTIGFGNTMINGRPVQPGDKLTVPQAEALMQKSVVQNYTNFVDKVTAPLTPNQFAALTSFEYNLGGGVWNSPTGRQILSLIQSGRASEAGRLMLAYNKVRNPQTGVLEPNRVLAQRRAREANLLLT